MRYSKVGYNLDDNLTKVFDNNYITKRHQKIVIKLSFDDIYKPSDAYEYCIDKHRAYVTYASLFVFPRQFDWGALSVCPKPFGFKGLKSHAWL